MLHCSLAEDLLLLRVVFELGVGVVELHEHELRQGLVLRARQLQQFFLIKSYRSYWK